MKLLTAIIPFSLMACTSTLPPSNCMTRPGLVNGPVVFEREAALAIAMAVLPERKRNSDQYDTVVTEYPDYWHIYQLLKSSEPMIEGDTIRITHGGGGGTLKIAKCDARIFEFHYMR